MARPVAAAARRGSRSRDAPKTLDPAEELLSTVGAMIERLDSALLPTTEIVLHNLRRLPYSIVAVAGNVTERKVGDPPTDVLLSHVASGAHGDLIGYQTSLPNGRQLLCSTIILRTASGEPVGAVCINNDVTHWTLLRGVAESALGADHPLEALLNGTRVLEQAQSVANGESVRLPEHGERFARSVGELAEHMINRCIDEVDVPVRLMKKEHKLRVVASLQEQGMFLIRDAVETVASSLQVSRFTIYNYLNEIGAEDGSANGSAAKPRSGRSGIRHD